MVIIGKYGSLQHCMTGFSIFDPLSLSLVLSRSRFSLRSFLSEIGAESEYRRTRVVLVDPSATIGGSIFQFGR
ncbi:hypothetical protein RJT34_29780 [Clitoria ternatea]|uniref:Uncharacterized protein n=1 Tax=Clitoria ternatea TaxID=43366 RepID=A0AAN9ER87_CLITE